MTRRVLLGTGAAVVGGAAIIGGAQLTGRLDDVADAVGLDPKPEPDPRDNRLVGRAGASAAGLLATLEATVARHPTMALAPLIDLVREQATAVDGGSAADAAPVPETPEEASRALEALFSSAASDRATDCGRAVSPDLARVLASMSAGLAQAAVAVRGLR